MAGKEWVEGKWGRLWGRCGLGRRCRCRCGCCTYRLRERYCGLCTGWSRGGQKGKIGWWIVTPSPRPLLLWHRHVSLWHSDPWNSTDSLIYHRLETKGSPQTNRRSSLQPTPWLVTTETDPHLRKTVIAKLHRTTADNPHLEDKDIGFIDKLLRQPTPLESLEPPPQLTTRPSTKHQDYKTSSTDQQKLREISCIMKPTDLSDFQNDPFYQKTTIWGAHYPHVISLNYDNLETIVRTYYSTVQITK